MTVLPQRRQGCIRYGGSREKGEGDGEGERIGRKEREKGEGDRGGRKGARHDVMKGGNRGNCGADSLGQGWRVHQTITRVTS